MSIQMWRNKGSMTKSGVNRMWQVFEWKHIISTSNSWTKGYQSYEQENFKDFSLERFGIFLEIFLFSFSTNLFDFFLIPLL